MFDTTIRLGDIIMGGITIIVIPIIKSLSVSLIDLRDTVKSLNMAMGSTNPPNGLLGDVHCLKEEVREHRDWLIGIKDRRS